MEFAQELVAQALSVVQDDDGHDAAFDAYGAEHCVEAIFKRQAATAGTRTVAAFFMDEREVSLGPGWLFITGPASCGGATTALAAPILTA